MYIPVNSPLIASEDISAVISALEGGWISGEGPLVNEFDHEMARSVGRKHAISVSNGTAALDIAVETLNLKSGDEVIVPTFTIISVINQILRAGAIPKFVDCHEDTWNMKVSDVEPLINSRTRAIFAVHTYGLPVDLDPLIAIAKKHQLTLIEDASEAHGLLYKGKQCGSFGEISTFSFYANKHITSGEGGMVLTDDDVLAEQLRSLKNLCFNSARRFVHEDIGWNARMSSLQCALAHSQLRRLPEILLRRREIALEYLMHLRDVKNLRLPILETQHGLNDFWVFGVVLTDSLAGKADYVREELDRAGIGTRPFFWPLHEQPVLSKFGISPKEKCPNAENLARSGFYLPNSLAITSHQIQFVCEKLGKVCNERIW